MPRLEQACFARLEYLERIVWDIVCPPCRGESSDGSFDSFFGKPEAPEMCADRDSGI